MIINSNVPSPQTSKKDHLPKKMHQKLIPQTKNILKNQRRRIVNNKKKNFYPRLIPKQKATN